MNIQKILKIILNVIIIPFIVIFFIGIFLFIGKNMEEFLISLTMFILLIIMYKKLKNKINNMKEDEVIKPKYIELKNKIKDKILTNKSKMKKNTNMGYIKTNNNNKEKIGIIEQLKGANGVIYLYENKIVISRKTFGGIITFGIVGDRNIFYNSIQGIELSGSILRIIPKGLDNTKSYNSISFSDVMLAQRDSNVILFSHLKVKTAQRICDIINSKVIETYSNEKNTTKNNNADAIREYKKLLDEGIITEEEFESKKQDLLK